MFEFKQLLSAAVLPRSSQQQHVPFHVSMLDLHHHDPALAFQLLYHPSELLVLFDSTVERLVAALRKHSEVQRVSGGNALPAQISMRGDSNGSNGRTFHVRLSQLPPSAEITKPSIGALRVSADSQHLLQITGTVRGGFAIQLFELHVSLVSYSESEIA